MSQKTGIHRDGRDLITNRTTFFFFFYVIHTRIIVDKEFIQDAERREAEKCGIYVPHVITPNQVYNADSLKATCAPFFPRHGGNSDTRLPCRCRVAPSTERNSKERARATERRRDRDRVLDEDGANAGRRSSEERRG